MTERPMVHKSRKRTNLIFAALGAIATLSLASCTKIPELDEAVPNWVRRADYPELTKLDPSTTTKVLPQDRSEEIEQEMTARQNNLERKANWLRTLDANDVDQNGTSDGITR
ncbi:MAG: hypothetical protein KUG70_14190 [Rhodobacteraceae bacterium]|nr:hypothetical protein [Paracoccaceae bacterium]